MKNLFIYYVLILAPLGILYFLMKAELIDATIFVVLLFFYAFVYRTYVDGKKLADKNIISKKDSWKMIIPGMRITYFKELYLE